MRLRETTCLNLKLVQEHSGHPVEVVATIRLAHRGRVLAHRLTYRPIGRQAPDHAIALQCGFALRLFGVPGDAVQPEATWLTY